MISGSNGSSPPEADRADTMARSVELAISRLLRIGVLVSLSAVVVGTILVFVHHPSYVDSRSALHRLTGRRAVFPHTVPSVARGVQALRGRAVIMAGLLVLIATPVVRVAVSILGFWYQRDRVFVAITSIVFALLLLSFVIGRAGG